VDIKNKFEKIFNLFIELLDAKSVMTASHVALNIGKIAKNSPNLREKIAAALLNIDKTTHETGRKELVKASVIEAYKEYLDEIKNKDEIISFVHAQLNS
jgi:hypothetical protein